MKRGLIFVPWILISGILLSAQELRPSFDGMIKIDQDNKIIRHLHFTLTIKPIVDLSQLTDLFYSVDYNEAGTNRVYEWVRIYDGHLINVPELGLHRQWKGPFSGIRQIRYQFYFELIDDGESDFKKSLLIRIFSTHPELDAEYFRQIDKSPFDVTAYYYDTKLIKRALQIYKVISNIKSGFKLISGIAHFGESANPVVGITAEIGMFVFEYLIVSEIEKRLDNPSIEIHLKCHVCKKEFVLPPQKQRQIYFECDTPGCGNRANITVKIDN